MKHILQRLFGRLGRRSSPMVDASVDYRALTENSSDIVLQFSANSEIRYISPSVTAILGWTPEEIMERPQSLMYEEDLPLVEAATARMVAGEVESEKIVYRMRCKDGSVRWMEGNARRVPGNRLGEQPDLAVIARDISERKALEEKLESLALKDGLTGLANRRAFDEALDRVWRDTLRHDAHLSLLLLDLDHFKGLNDHYGHQVGDDCLRAIAVVVMDSAKRPVDVAARYGGEELAVILPETDQAGASAVAERIRQAIEALELPNPANLEGGERVTASIGAATALSRIGGTNAMPQALLLAADSALYKAKEEGRNCVRSTMVLVPPGAG